MATATRVPHYKQGNDDGGKGVRQGMATVTKRAMATATRVVGNKEGDGNKDCNGNRDKGGGQQGGQGQQGQWQ